jgi:pyrimidine oxygenase
MMRSYGMEADGRPAIMGENAKDTFMTHTVFGTPETCLEKLKAQIEGCELDGVMLIFPDYVKGLSIMGAEVLPQLKAHFA